MVGVILSLVAMRILSSSTFSSEYGHSWLQKQNKTKQNKQKTPQKNKNRWSKP